MPKQQHGGAPHRLDVAIGHRLRERRRAMGMTQVELGAAISLTSQQIQKYETGGNRISFSRLVEIAEALNCQLNDLTQGLIAASPPDELEALNALLAKPGAMAMLEAYAALRFPDLQKAVIQLTKTLAGAPGPADGLTGPGTGPRDPID